MEWKNIEGYRYPYRINEYAEIQRILPDGTFKTLKQYKHLTDKNYGRMCVTLSSGLNKGEKVYVVNLMVKYFLGGKRDGYVVTHRNGMITDCSKKNLAFATRKFIGKRYSGNGRHSVEKVDAFGDVIDLYKSVSEAARKNSVSRKYISQRCGGKIKSPLFGYTFRYER